ncbi:hypothetical protein [Ruegeria sp. Ofav3-42]|uniref:hypothetical protein n=1 Tax=Ruegeria sp. Ofav3-42 TaxID=2917759 RepID=UPI001EF5F58F|nr:hypothetical protein [Ruegeria sp. Ofav3-42]MCG7521485.1 hypothetical protein [Ruegeria sp. Ofav3-42]
MAEQAAVKVPDQLGRFHNLLAGIFNSVSRPLAVPPPLEPSASMLARFVRISDPNRLSSALTVER